MRAQEALRGAALAKYPSIDLLRGVMILLVMAGHAMELAHRDALAMWIGAGFRMPLMVGLSGYLLNVARARSAPMGDFLGRHGERMLLPWLVALAVYHVAGGGGLGWSLPLDMALRPPFHLWYIPVLFALILMTRLLSLRPAPLLAIVAPFALATMYALGVDHRPLGAGPLAPDSRYLLYPVFFVFGMLIAERGMPRRLIWAPLVLVGLGALWWASLHGVPAGPAHVPARLLLCLGLIALLPAFAGLKLRLAPINRVGRESLFFYLWHPLLMGLAMACGADPLTALGVAALLLYVVSLLPGDGLLPRLLKGRIRPRVAQPAAPEAPSGALPAY